MSRFIFDLLKLRFVWTNGPGFLPCVLDKEVGNLQNTVVFLCFKGGGGVYLNAVGFPAIEFRSAGDS